jgi:hypothetical protein
MFLLNLRFSKVQIFASISIAPVALVAKLEVTSVVTMEKAGVDISMSI